MSVSLSHCYVAKGTCLTWLSSGEPSRQVMQAFLASAFTGCVQAAATADAGG